MPKAILEFNLPEEQEEFKLASNAIKMSADIHNFYNYLRNKHKHGDYKGKERELIDEIYRDFCEAFENELRS